MATSPNQSTNDTGIGSTDPTNRQTSVTIADRRTDDLAAIMDADSRRLNELFQSDPRPAADQIMEAVVQYVTSAAAYVASVDHTSEIWSTSKAEKKEEYEFWVRKLEELKEDSRTIARIRERNDIFLPLRQERAQSSGKKTDEQEQEWKERLAQSKEDAKTLQRIIESSEAFERRMKEEGRSMWRSEKTSGTQSGKKEGKA